MQIKKLNRNNQILRDVLKNSCSKNEISLLQTIKKYCSKNCRKDIRGIFTIMSNSYNGAFFAKMVNRWKALTTSEKNYVIGVSQGPKYAYEVFFC